MFIGFEQLSIDILNDNNHGQDYRALTHWIWTCSNFGDTLREFSPFLNGQSMSTFACFLFDREQMTVDEWKKTLAQISCVLSILMSTWEFLVIWQMMLINSFNQVLMIVDDSKRKLS